MSSINHLKKSKKQAQKKGQLKEVADICNVLGREFQDAGDFDSALEQHSEECSIQETLNDKIGVAIAHRRLGEVRFQFDLNNWW